MRYLCIFFDTTESSKVNRKTKRTMVAEFTKEESRKIGTISVSIIQAKVRNKYSGANFFKHIRNMQSERLMLRDAVIWDLEKNNNDKFR